MMLTDDDLAFYSCGDWEEKINVFTTAENIIGMTPANPVEVPLQPDGSLKMQAKETNGASVVNSSSFSEPASKAVTFGGISSEAIGISSETIGMSVVNSSSFSEPAPKQITFDGTSLSEPEVKAKETIGAETVNTDAVVRLQKLCDEAEPCKAKLTFQYQEKSAGWDHRLEAKALDRGAKQGMTLEALETVFAIACQQVPSMEQRWMELKGEINVMFAKKWAAEDMPS